MKEMKLRINKIISFVIVNVILLIFLYNIPISNNSILENLCVYKNLFGKECWNCGMTRAFLAILHGEFAIAINYNSRALVIFFITILIYLHSWYKFIIKSNN